ncbi:MAG: sensor histidine kinase [Rhodothalassiaceae bacterium]|nr:MAG: sensor histidine kinase [Rhodothalassiaceae bacterium]
MNAHRPDPPAAAADVEVRGTLIRRLFLSSLLWVVATLLAGGFVLTFAFADYVQKKFEADLMRRLDALIGAAEVDELGQIRFSRALEDPRYAEPYSGRYWQISAPDQPAFRSRSLWDHALDPDWDAPAREATLREAEGPAGEPLEIAVQDVELPGADVTFRFMVAADTREMRADIASFRRLVLLSMAGFGLALTAAIAVQLLIALRPLRAVRRALQRVRAGAAERITGRFPVEFGELVRELNALIAQNEELVERARRHAGNLAHALKTPLSVLANAAGRADGELARLVGEQIAIMQRHIDHHLKRARAGGAGPLSRARSPVAETVARLVRVMHKIHAARGAEIRFDVPAGLVFRGSRQDLEEIVGNLLDNACKWARRRVAVAARALPDAAGGARIEITVDDDGPGVPAERRQDLFRRGLRLDESQPGSGLGLAIVMDIVRLYGGSVALEDSPLGGLRVRLQLPAAPPAA